MNPQPSLSHFGLHRTPFSREKECRAAVDEAFSLAHARGHRSLDVHLRSVLGLLELGLGNIRAAVEQLVLCARKAKAEGLGNPSTVPYEPDLVEALHAAGRDEEARAGLDQLERHSEQSRSPWGLATAARCRGLLASEGDFEAQFLSALALHEQVPSRFELARTQLCFGERLRRLRRKREAHEQLSAALSAFEDLAATP